MRKPTFFNYYSQFTSYVSLIHHEGLSNQWWRYSFESIDVKSTLSSFLALARAYCSNILNSRHFFFHRFLFIREKQCTRVNCSISVIAGGISATSLFTCQLSFLMISPPCLSESTRNLDSSVLSDDVIASPLMGKHLSASLIPTINTGHPGTSIWYVPSLWTMLQDSNAYVKRRFVLKKMRKNMPFSGVRGGEHLREFKCVLWRNFPFRKRIPKDLGSFLCNSSTHG